MAQWVFKIAGNDADNLTRSYTPETGYTLRILKNAAGKWSLVHGEWVEPHDDSSLGQFGQYMFIVPILPLKSIRLTERNLTFILAMKGGAIALEAHVTGCVIRPWVSNIIEKEPIQAPWEVSLPKSRKRCRKAAFLRPGDVVRWTEEDINLSISFTAPCEAQSEQQIEAEMPHVEVKSSGLVKLQGSIFGMDGAGDDPADDETDSEEEDSLDVKPSAPAGKSPEFSFSREQATSQPKTPSTPGEPYSTARTAPQVIRETPTIRRQRPENYEETKSVAGNDSSTQQATAHSSGPAIINDSMKTVPEQEMSDDEAPDDKSPEEEAADEEALDVEAPKEEDPQEALDGHAIDGNVKGEEVQDEEGPDEEDEENAESSIEPPPEDANHEAEDMTHETSEAISSANKQQSFSVGAHITTPTVNTDTQDERELPELQTVLSQSSAKNGKKRKVTDALEVPDEASTAQSTQSEKSGKKRKATEAPQDSEETLWTQSSASSKKLRTSQTPITYGKAKKVTSTTKDAHSPGISDSPASHRKASQADGYSGPSPRILFSNTDVNNRPTLKKFLTEQKARQSNDFKKSGSNFLCVGPGELKTTAKLLMALLLRKEIVTDTWVTDSEKAGYLLQTADYLPEALVSTKDIDRSALFTGKNVYFTPAVKKSYGEGFSDICTIVRAAGAKGAGSEPSRNISDTLEVVAIGLEEGDNDVPVLQGKNITVYKKDLISSSILEGEIQTDNRDLVIVRKEDTKKAEKQSGKNEAKKTENKVGKNKRTSKG